MFSPPNIVQQQVTIILPHKNISWLRLCAWVNGLFKIKRLYRLIFAQYKTTSRLVIYAALWEYVFNR